MSILKIPITAEDHIQGNINAPITLVEYGDYECPYCRMANPMVKRLQKHYGDKMRFVFRNFPLSNIHHQAEMAAEAAEFAAAYGHFWEMHDLLYDNQNMLGMPLFISLSESLQLPTEELMEAIEKDVYKPKIRHDFLGGVQSGVNGTPTFYINGLRHGGTFELDAMIAAIDEALSTSHKHS